MDDVVLIHHDKEELQKMLNTTNDIARRFHIKFGREKSQLLTIGNAEPPPEMKLGNDVLDKTDTYRYLELGSLSWCFVGSRRVVFMGDYIICESSGE